MITPTSGTGALLGIPIQDKRARERVGFLPEDPSFCTYLRAAEFLDLCGKVLHLDRATRKQRIAEVLEMVGLTPKARTRIAEFSCGSCRSTCKPFPRGKVARKLAPALL